MDRAAAVYTVDFGGAKIIEQLLQRLRQGVVEGRSEPNADDMSK